MARPYGWVFEDGDRVRVRSNTSNLAWEGRTGVVTGTEALGLYKRVQFDDKEQSVSVTADLLEPESPYGPEVQHILEWLAEETECYYDHHGLCQAHYLSEKEKCPVLVAKRLLGRTET